jgi:hypothetical protein
MARVVDSAHGSRTPAENAHLLDLDDGGSEQNDKD